jgi:hypothetical protein
MQKPLIFHRKVVYVARDPREVVVSYFHHHRLIRHHEFVEDFPTFFDYFLKEKGNFIFLFWWWADPFEVLVYFCSNLLTILEAYTSGLEGERGS